MKLVLPKLINLNSSKQNSQQGIMGILVLIAIVVALIVLVLSSDNAKVGDDFSFVDEAVEGFQLSLSALTPSEKFVMEAKIAHERIVEAQQLYKTPGREEDFKSAIKKYGIMQANSTNSLKTALVRGFDSNDFLPQYLQFCIDNLSILASVYQTNADGSYNFMDPAINLTLESYKDGLDTLFRTRGEAATLDIKSKFYDVEQQLRDKDAPYSTN